MLLNNNKEATYNKIYDEDLQTLDFLRKCITGFFFKEKPGTILLYQNNLCLNFNIRRCSSLTLIYCSKLVWRCEQLFQDVTDFVELKSPDQMCCFAQISSDDSVCVQES